MFDYFQASHTRAVVVLNEFGGVAGFITIYDVLRYIFGELAIKTKERVDLDKVAPRIYELAGDVKLTELNRLTGIDLKDPRMTTIAGVAFRSIDRIPKVGDQVNVDEMTITVLEMDVHRIARVRLALNGEEETATGESDAAGDELPEEKMTEPAPTADSREER